VTTYQGQPASAAWLAALLRDIAIVVAVILYAIDTL
jgi:hypothetical protein